jgi:hypothetical protein
MSLHTVIKATTDLNEIIKAVTKTEPSPVDDEETLYQYYVSEDTCKEIIANIRQQVLNNIICYDFATNVYGPERRNPSCNYVGEARSPEKKTSNISFTYPRFHQTRADSNYRLC